MKLFESLNKFNNKAFLNKNLGSPHRYIGFTLSEVIITLGIIGVVAAMTIPALLNNINNQQLKTAWKKDYSLINQVYLGITKENYGLINTFNNIDDLINAFAEALKYTKKCSNAVTEGCLLSSGYDWYDYFSSPRAYNHANWGISRYNKSLNLINGSTIFFDSTYSSSCSLSLEISVNYCGIILVDVNSGLKKPNVIGKDIFAIYILPDKLMPGGGRYDTVWASHSTSNCTTKMEGGGLGCGAKYLFD